MADFSTVISQFFEENMILLIILFAIPIIIIYIYRIWRKIPVQPDYIKVFRDDLIHSEKMNKVDKKYGIRSLWRGKEYLGKIVTHSEGIFNVPRKSELVKMGRTTQRGQPIDLSKEKMKIFTIVYKPPVFSILGFTFCMGREVLKFSEKDDFIVEDKGKLIFPSDTSFTAMGQIYATLNSYQQLSTTILDHWNKNLLQANTALFSSEMVKISAQTPQMSHELQLKRLEIERIRADKQMKLGSII